MRFRFNHHLLLGQIEQAISDYRRLLGCEWVDSARAAGIERRLRDPATRVAAFRQEASDSAASIYMAVAIRRFVDGDDSVIAFLSRVAKTPRRDEISPGVLGGVLSPQLRANPRMHEVMAKLGYPPLQEEHR